MVSPTMPLGLLGAEAERQRAAVDLRAGVADGLAGFADDELGELVAPRERCRR